MNQKPSVMLTEGGLWNTRRPQHSTENTRVMKTLIDEARVNNFQYSQLTNNMLRGASLSTQPELSAMQSRAPLHKRVKPVRPSKASSTTGLRTYNDIVNSGAYIQPEYHPKPTKARTDAEKDRLANLMAYGVDPTRTNYPTTKSPSSPTREIDRFDELVLEVEQRKTFLHQMTLLGKRKDYQEVIANEIADKVREMEQIDRQRSKALERHLKEQYSNS